jgi:Putative porin
MDPTLPRRTLLAAALIAALSTPVLADEKKELEQLRATTLGLIEALVQQGLIPRDRADALLRQAQVPSSAAATPAAPAAPAWGMPPQAAAAPVIRVPYVSETTKAQIREEIRNDVLTVAREERWADPRALPSWVRGLTIGGDVRVRWQQELYDSPRYAPGVTDPCQIVGGNLPAECWRSQAATPAWGPDVTNTTNDRDRLTLRARLAIGAKVSDDTSAGLRITTGTTSGPTSSSQTLGQGFNKSSIVLDRAFLRYEPRHDFRLIAGRMANPFFGSDLLWPDDLSFDGVAVQAERNVAAGSYVFGTVGAFPLEEFNVDSRDKWLYAFQIGGEAAVADHTMLRIGLASYHFVNVQGVRETDPPPTGPRAGTVPSFTSQYPTSVRLKGNTLINLNDPTSTAAPTWGLASRFRPINLMTALTLSHYDPVSLSMQLDWVHNSAFDVAEIEQRAGVPLADLAERNTGLQARLQFGMPQLDEAGQWQLFGAWRRFERDAWIDGFTDTTWHVGGTNYEGWQLGGHYAFDRRTSLGFRLTSTRNLEDGVTDGNGVPTASNNPLKIDVLQVDLNTRF